MDAIFNSLVPKTVRNVCCASNDRDQYGTKTGPVVTLPTYIESTGAVAIIDLSGYTGLTELLFEAGDSLGGERVYNAVNPFFEGLINVCEEYHGDVVKFCGDALIVSWPVFGTGYDNSDQVEKERHALARAFACSLAVLQHFGSYSVSLDDDAADQSAVISGLGLPNLGKDKSASSMVLNPFGMGHSHGASPTLLRKELSRTKTEDSSNSINVITLGVHIGIGFGSIFHHFVGKANSRCEYLILGSAVESAGEMLGKTKRGEVCLGSDQWNTLQTSIPSLSNIGTGNSAKSQSPVLLTLSMIPEGKILSLLAWTRSLRRPTDVPICLDIPSKSFIMESAVGRIKEINAPELFTTNVYQLHLRLSELRKIIVVFLKIDSPALRGPIQEQSRFVQQVCRNVHRLLEKHSGHLRQLVYDDKGFTALMVWGLPPSSSMDESHALNCSLRLKEFFRTLPSVNLSIGVSEGKSYTGIIGGSKRQDYNLFGRCVNLAARCMSSEMAKKSILCDGLFHGPVAEEFKFGEDISLYLKGVSEQRHLRVLIDRNRNRHRPESAHKRTGTADGHNTSLESHKQGIGSGVIGRSGEVEIISRVMDNWFQKSQQSLLIVHGNAGIGKTALTKIVKQKLVADGIKDRVFFLLPRFDMQLNGHIPGASRLSISGNTNASGSRHSMSSMHSSRSFHSAASAGKRALLRQLVNYILTVVHNKLRAKVVILIDNYQWADSKSQGFINQLRVVFPQILYVIVSRSASEYSQGDKSQLKSFCEDKRATVIPLEPLSQPSTKELVENLFGKEVHKSLAQQIYDKTGGIPLLIKSLSERLKKLGAVVESEGRLQLDGNKKNLISFENTPASIVTPQYDALSSKFREIVGIASVMGSEFTLKDLEYVSRAVSTAGPIDIDSMPEFIKRNDTFKFLTTSSDGDEICYRFTSDFIQQGIYQLMLKKSRDIIHFNALQRRIQLLEALDSEADKTSELSPKQIKHLLLLNYHLDKINPGNTEDDWYFKYKGMMLLYFYDRQMPTEALNVYEDLLEFYKTHPNGNFPSVTRAKYAALMADFYDIVGNDAKSHQCVQEAMYLVTGKKLPESNLGKIGFIIRRIFGVSKHLKELSEFNYERVEIAEKFYVPLDDPWDIMIDSLHTRATLSSFKMDILELFMAVLQCMTLKAAPFQRPINIYSVKVSVVFGYAVIFGSEDVASKMIQFRREIVGRMLETFAATPNLSNLYIFFWQLLSARNVICLEEMEKFGNLACTMSEDLQISNTTKITSAPFFYVREALYLQGKFYELRNRIEELTSGLRSSTYNRHITFAQEMCYRSEMMDLASAHRNYEKLLKITEESPPLLPLLRRDIIEYELMMRISEIAQCTHVDKSESHRVEFLMDSLLPTIQRYCNVDKNLAIGSPTRTLILFRIASLWMLFAMRSSCVNVNVQQLKTPYVSSSQRDKDCWRIKKCTPFLQKALLSGIKWATFVKSPVNNDAKQLIVATQQILKNQLNLAIKIFEEVIPSLETNEELEYLSFLVKTRLIMVKILVKWDEKQKQTKKSMQKIMPHLEGVLKGYKRELESLIDSIEGVV
ncbi:Adenylate cyclase type 10 [Blyttiomyces sp. JEL0837]|nr:Adenylate cyclase type 10 [Blyttiomyces sp. JEL0837]